MALATVYIRKDQEKASSRELIVKVGGKFYSTGMMTNNKLVSYSTFLGMHNHLSISDGVMSKLKFKAVDLALGKRDKKLVTDTKDFLFTNIRINTDKVT